jgi:hypothetical protein
MTAVPRRIRKGSSSHSRSSAGAASSTATPSFQASPGTIVSRNEKVSRSMIITSTKVMVIISIVCLKCDSRMRVTISANDSAAAVIGRRSSASNRKLSKPQVRTKATADASSRSDPIMSPNAVR